MPAHPTSLLHRSLSAPLRENHEPAHSGSANIHRRLSLQRFDCFTLTTIRNKPKRACWLFISKSQGYVDSRQLWRTKQEGFQYVLIQPLFGDRKQFAYPQYGLCRFRLPCKGCNDTYPGGDTLTDHSWGIPALLMTFAHLTISALT